MNEDESEDGKLCLWSVSDRSLARSEVFDVPLAAADFSLDGGSIFVARALGGVEVLDLTFKRVGLLAMRGEMRDLWTLSNGLVAVLSTDALSLVDPRDGRAVAKIATKKGSHGALISDVHGDVIATRKPVGYYRVV